MSKICIFSNLKGGVGKSTLCIQFANYLAGKGENVAVLDADLQEDVFEFRQRELKQYPDAVPLWRVWSLAGQDVRAFIEKAKLMDGWILIDCPGTLNDANLTPVFRAADAAVIPFRYDDMVLSNTVKFAKYLRGISNAKLFFLPNNIDVRVKFPNEEAVRDSLWKIGRVLPRVKTGVAIQRVSTLTQDDYQKKAVMYAADDLMHSID